jgi:hypothetical protein
MDFAPAVDGDHLARDEASIVTEEERHDAREIGWHATPEQRRVGLVKSLV